MPGRPSLYEKLAKEAVERVEADRAMQEQLTLLPDEDAGAELETDGHAARGPGKALSQMREYLAAKGYRFPEEVLAQIAGLDRQGGDTLEAAMAQADRILAWASHGARKEKIDGTVQDAQPTLGQRLATLQQVRAAQLRAADALMPYGAPKATPEEPQKAPNRIVMPQQPADPASQARDVTPQRTKIGTRMMPADVAHEIKQNQQVSESNGGKSDAESRTK
ncbi:MAG: hypothetical protein AAFZ02_10965 [Pseudomonadota bacterium]